MHLLPVCRLIICRVSQMSLALAVCLALTVSCKANYPRCSGDADCLGHAEVCVQGSCQECATAAHCEKKYPGEHRSCVGGRCERAAECASDHDCKTDGRDFVCRDGACRPECTKAQDCPSGKTCVSQKCVASCAGDLDCPEDALCVSGVCTDKATALQMGRHSCHPTRPGDTIALDTVHFPFNQSDLDADARAALEHAAACLRQAPKSLRVIVEGHCDDRGTQEYNLALGERRAQAVMNYLRSLGAPTDALEVVSKGENEPLCSEANDACYAQNRRVQFLQQPAATAP